MRATLTRWRPRRLSTKLTIPFIAVLVSALAVLGVVSTRSVRTAMTQSLDKRAEIFVDLLAASLADPLSLGEVERLQQLLDKAKQSDPDVAYATLVDAKGTVIASTDPTLKGQVLLRTDFEKAMAQVVAFTRRPVPGAQNLFEVATPVKYQVLGKLGTLGIGFTTAHIDQIVLYAQYLVLIVGLTALLLGTVLYIYVARVTARPLREVVASLEELARGEGDLTRQIEVRTNDEIGALSRAFNIFLVKFNEIIAVANRISKGDFSVTVSPQSDRDGLGRAFSQMVSDLRSIAQAAGRISEGDLTVTVVPRSEQDLLGQALHRMAEALQRRQAETERKTRELQALYTLTNTISRSLNIDSCMQVALLTTIQVLKVDAGRLYILDEKDHVLHLTAHDGLPVEQLRSIECYAPGEGIVGRTFKEMQPLVFADIASDPEYAAMARGARGRDWGFRSAASFPITVKGEPVGVIYVYGRSVREFTSQDIELLSAIGSQVGVAVENARLFQETEQRARQQEALNAIATATSQSLDLKELFEIALDKTVEVTGRNRVNIRLKDPLTGRVELIVHRGFSDGEMEELRRRTPHPMSEEVFASGNPLIINDTGENRNRDFLERNRSVAWVPIKAGARVVGVLGISDNQSKPFFASEVELLEAIGSVIGVAIKNARLFEETQQRNRELQALYTVSNKISRSVDIESLMQAALMTTIEVLKVDAGRLYVFDGKINALRLAAHWGIPEDQLSGIGDYAPGEGVIGRIFVENRPFVFADVETDPNYQTMARGKLAQRGGYRSVAGLPITIKDRPVGVIYLYGKAVREFTPQDIALLSTIGDQIGVAIENARLFRETQRNLERARALREIDQAITSTLDLHTVLDVLLGKIDLVLPYAAVTVRLFNKASGLLEPVACRNLDEKEWKAEEWRGGRGTPNAAFESKAPVMVSNVQTDPRNRDPEFFRKHGLVSYLGLPLIAQSEVLGVISFYTKEEHEFANEEVEFLTTLAEQAAIAIHNSQLYQEMMKLAADLSRSNKVKDEFLSVMSHELRTPLNVVMGYTGMIRDGLLGEINPEQEKALDKVITRAQDQLTMISSILQATQLEAEGGKVETGEVSLKDLLDDLRSGYEIPLGKDLSLIWDYPSDLPVIHTDGEKLKHILQNLINNAIKFTEKGHVTVAARYLNGVGGSEQSRKQEKPNSQDGVVELKVSDTGVGIAKEHLSLIFERFRQVDSSETRHYGGVGIGLYIVKKFTELLGGMVEVESEPGKGSTFTVVIPYE